jgi:hypothetical protein
MKLTKSQNDVLNKEVLVDAKYWLNAILGHYNFIKGGNYQTKKFMVGNKAVFTVTCGGYTKEYTIGRNGKLETFSY